MSFKSSCKKQVCEDKSTYSTGPRDYPSSNQSPYQAHTNTLHSGTSSRQNNIELPREREHIIHTEIPGDMFLFIIGVSAVVLFIKWFTYRLKMKDVANRYVLVTGCDSGFGMLLAKRLDTLGMHVFAGCYTKDAMEEYRKSTNSNIISLLLDVTDKASIQNALQFVNANLPENTGLWALVNNAGIMGHWGPVTWLSEDDYQRPLSVNLFGMIRMVRVFLPLVLRSKGRIVCMTSGSGKVAAANVGPYSVSKFAAEGYCDTLRRELWKTGVSVHIIEPGCFKTGFTNIPLITKTIQRNFDKLDDSMKEFYGQEYVTEINTNFENLIDAFDSPKLYKVVDAYEHAITSSYPKIRYVIGPDSNTMIFLTTYFPEWVVDFLFCSTTIPVPMAYRK